MTRLIRYGAQRGPVACKFCGAEIVWALTDHDRRMPVDVAPAAAGYWVLWYSPDEEPEPLQRVSHFRSSAVIPSTPLRWVAHWGTCSEREVRRHLAERHEAEKSERGQQLDMFAGVRR